MDRSRPQFHFRCTRCGRCCRWPGYVLLTDEDITRMAHKMDVREEVCIQKYTRLASNRAQLSLIDAPDGACIFLEGDQCSMYEARPAQCRAFPFPSATPDGCPGLTVLPSSRS